MKIKCDCGKEFDDYRICCPGCGIPKYSIGKITLTINDEVIPVVLEDAKIEINLPEVKKHKKETKATVKTKAKTEKAKVSKKTK